MKVNPLIVALDVQDAKKAISIVKNLNDYVDVFKIGPVLFTKYGPDIIKKVQDYGKKIFLDFKLYDIPNTVASTVKAIIDLNVFMFTVHIAGGMEMLKAAVNELKDKDKRPKILGVTVLTSVAGISNNEILQKVEIAKESGIDGVISSPLEVINIRSVVSKDFIIVTPGIRPAGTESGDQKRVATPKKAIQNGADFIVIGRPIIESADPVNVVKNVLADISSL